MLEGRGEEREATGTGGELRVFYFCRRCVEDGFGAKAGAHFSGACCPPPSARSLGALVPAARLALFYCVCLELVSPVRMCLFQF